MVGMDKCGIECEVYSHTFGKCYYEEEIRKDAIERFAKWLEDNGYLHIVEPDYTKMKVRMKSRSVDAKTVIERYESEYDDKEVEE